MSEAKGTQRVLGLDLGVNSVGWALFEFAKGDATALIATGSRVFEAGVEGTSDDIAKGQDESRATKRRQARMLRRQTERRGRRQSRLAHVLQATGLLPDGAIDSPQERHDYFVALDRTLRGRLEDEGPPTFPHTFPYWLRARALDHRLERDELGRALYHLGQRRGFLSNRKAGGKDKDEELGKVKEGIGQLADAMRDAHARTLGEYLAGLDPADPKQRRIRERWTGRQMYLDEFDAIWDAQAQHHPKVLTEDAYECVRNAIFFQRPLKAQKHLVGSCRLERERKRAPLALLAAQRFRLLQKVNDLRIVDNDLKEHPLEPGQRDALLAKLEITAELKFTQARRLLKLPKGYKFNLERGGEDRLVGNRTAARLRRIFGAQWDAFSPKERDRVVDDARSFEKEEALARRGRDHYGLDSEKAAKFGALQLEDGYCALSRQALAKLLPLMEGGTSFKTAEKEVYGVDEDAIAAVELLPSVAEAQRQLLIPDLRNPAVSRALTELAKVVNGVINAHGKPDMIRLELARDLKNPRERRKRIWKRNRQNQKSREGAATRILKEMGNQRPSRTDIQRVLLADECNWECPYTGHHISMSNLLGEASQFDIEHIIPFSRCLDDSFLNKTLCYHEENRSVKRKRTPQEAYSGDTLDTIIARVRRFKGDAAEAKLRRFLMTSEEVQEQFSDFSQRMLNDTRYASTLAAKYLALLYGSEWRKHIQVATGQVTAYLRDIWSLNKILSDGPKKSRDDHRHHAVDAIVIGLTGPKVVKALSVAAQKTPINKRRKPGDIPVPWKTFLHDVQAAIDACVVSHRVSRKVNARLHEDTFYSPPREDEDGKTCVHVRKRLDGMSIGEVNAIVDLRVREAVLGKLEELGEGDPKKAFASPENHPSLTSKRGQTIPIHKARIKKVLTPFQVGQGARARHVVSDTNHHMEILEIQDERGRTRWESRMVDQYVALRRQARGESVVTRIPGQGRRFVCSLSSGELFQIDSSDGDRRVYVARTVSGSNVEFVDVNDARRKVDIKAEHCWAKRSVDALRQLGFQKVTITPLGEVRRAND